MIFGWGYLAGFCWGFVCGDLVVFVSLVGLCGVFFVVFFNLRLLKCL